MIRKPTDAISNISTLSTIILDNMILEANDPLIHIDFFSKKYMQHNFLSYE